MGGGEQAGGAGGGAEVQLPGSCQGKALQCMAFELDTCSSYGAERGCPSKLPVCDSVG